MYIGYGNRSQYPTYDRLPGTRYLNPHNSGLAMDALEGGDPYELDEFDPEYTPIRGNDPDWWRSEKPISDKAINEAIKKVLKKKLFES